MDILLILTYSALCVFIFKVFRIPLNKWTVPTAVLGGVLIIGALILLMNYNHPYSEVARQYFITTPIIPTVKGRVIEVPVKPNTPLKQGDVLFKIDPRPFEYQVQELEASVEQAMDELKLAQTELQRAEKVYKQGAGSPRDVDNYRRKVAQSEGSVGEYQAELDDARYDLEQTLVRAPSDGFVTQLALRPGAMALPIGLKPVMTFIHKQERIVIGWFRQNSLLRLEKGSEAEVTLDGVPGVIFKGEVDYVIPAISEGQLVPTAELLEFDQEKVAGRVGVAIKITDPAFDDYFLPGGTYGQAAIYSEHFHHVGIIRRVLLRMNGWMNYVFPFH